MLNHVMNFAGFDECLDKCVKSMFVDSGGHIVHKDFLWLSSGYEGREANFPLHQSFPVNLTNVEVCW